MRLVWAVGALLGEGPVWHPGERALWFTDIKGCRLHRYDPANGGRQSFPVPHGVGFLVCAEGGGMVLGMDSGLHLFEAGKITRRLARIAEPPPGTRINDGTVDSAGRIWFGTMDDAERAPTGAVHMHTGDGLIHHAGGAAVVTNGPALSVSGDTLYHVDSAAGLIWRFDVTHDHRLQHGELFARIDPAHGAPDGITLDAEGCLWVCLWGGWAVRRYSPDGTLLHEVPLPVSQVTKLAFGDDGLRTAYVTTAAIGRNDEPLAGGLFAFDPGVSGLSAPAARIPGEV